jgi:predicted nucleic acid-binding protein
VRFTDTSVLLYAISRDPAEQDKAKRASDILADRDLALPVQVLQEFYVQATRASRPGRRPGLRRNPGHQSVPLSPPHLCH